MRSNPCINRGKRVKTMLDKCIHKGGAMLTITKKLAGESAKDYVARQLTYNIVHVNLIPGQKLDSKELCNLLKVSANPLREAELALAQSKLLEIRSKIGVYVSLIDTKIVEQVRELRSVLEAELAVQACDVLSGEQINLLWENIALWKMYIKRGDEQKIFSLDKQFHSYLYKMCGKDFWYELVEHTAAHFDRTTILSFRCTDLNRILADHEELVSAIEDKNKDAAYDISRRHLQRYTENLSAIKESYSEFIKL